MNERRGTVTAIELLPYATLLLFPQFSIGPCSMEAKFPNYRHTKIIATLGPATESREKLSQLINVGVDVFRLNMAHATGQWVNDVIGLVREVSAQIGRDVAVMIDVKGPEIRTGSVDEPIELVAGEELHLYTANAEAPIEGEKSVSVNYPDLPRDIDVGATVLIDSGLMRLKVISKTTTTVRCKVLTPGSIGSRRHINLPGVEVNLPALTKKDEADLIAGIAAGVDFVALSFVRRAADIHTLRKFLDERGSNARIIAKIEEQAGVRNMDEIIDAADAIMVARGDLGIEIDYHRLPLVQTQLVSACQLRGKPVIIATHLLESMIQSPIPTRAEISDVSNAVREQADAVMLSGETTTGLYPLESVDALKNIIQSIEPSVSSDLNSRIELLEPKAKMLRAAAVLAQDLGQSGIVVFTRSGFLAYVLGALRPRGVPIFAFTDVESTFRQLLLPWGVEPFLMEFSDDPEQTIQDSLDRLKQNRWCVPGSWLVVITNALANEKVIDTMQLRKVE
ncbi:pyruvate kinase [Rubripirellula reticaptiva]|uniref:Pyruvate kinase n=1 Tax=Rubripirellula reticaptiva TaxID=2528013 RepID=A0A5C6F7W2_9BACT|nr:pyruvate kinase [Rubripirellula reticaptiva]TWU57813.1 Pyruvate kinase [Rubripirellula reticaptiva]